MMCVLRQCISHNSALVTSVSAGVLWMVLSWPPECTYHRQVRSCEKLPASCSLAVTSRWHDVARWRPHVSAPQQACAAASVKNNNSGQGWVCQTAVHGDCIPSKKRFRTASTAAPSFVAALSSYRCCHRRQAACVADISVQL